MNWIKHIKTLQEMSFFQVLTIQNEAAISHELINSVIIQKGVPICWVHKRRRLALFPIPIHHGYSTNPPLTYPPQK